MNHAIFLDPLFGCDLEQQRIVLFGCSPQFFRLILELANQYIKDKLVGKTSYADCLHIALASINKADYLISWNFKHIVNVERIRGYNSINIKHGYKQLEIRSPREFEKYEDY